MAADNDKTVRINNDDSDKTVRADHKIINATLTDDADKTVRAGSGIISAENDATVRANGTVISYEGVPLNQTETKVAVNVTQQQSFLLNQQIYKKLKVISESTGEAQIFLLEKDGEKSVLKLYYPNIKPKEALIKKMRSISHKDILKVLDYGYCEGRFFELLEFAAGGTLDTYLPLRDMKKIKEIVEETADALEYCHGKGIIHRDIKPENIFYKNADGSDVLIGDFGISSLLDENQEAQVTGQARTMVYAAPELYQSLDGKAFVTKELDYYALGIMLIKIWTAENPFKGIPEMGIMRIKNLGRLNLPDDMPEELKNLIKGLTVVSLDKRWGYQEIKKWLRGESIAVYVETDKSKYKPFVYDQDQDLIANNPVELAKYLQDYPDIGKKYLYRGKITKWLEECNNQKLAVNLEEIYETLYAKDEDAGLQVAIYLLDPDLPYIAVDGTKCRSTDDFVKVLQDNADTYMKNLQNKNDSFYLYLSANGLNKEAKEYRKYFKEYVENIALLNVIYSLNPDTPFRFDDNHNATTLEELAELMIKNPKRGKELLYSNEIGVWVSFMDQGLLDQINSIAKKFENNQNPGLECAIYALDPKIGYKAVDGTICTTKEELAEALSNNFKEYTKRLSNGNDNFYMFLIARGLDNEYSAFRSFYNKSYDKGKIGFTSPEITLFKIIRGLGGKTPFKFENKVFTKPDQLLTADTNIKAKLLPELAKKDSLVNAWISVFYHEDPFLTIKKKGEYEYKLKEYVEFVEKLNSENQFVKRYKEAANTFFGMIDRESGIDNRFNLGKWISIVFPVLCAAGLFYYVYTLKHNPLPGAFWDVSKYYYFAIIAITMFYVGMGMIDDGKFSLSTLLIGGPIVGIVAGVIVYYAFMLAVSLWFILAAIIAASLYFSISKILKEGYKDAGMHAQLFDRNDFGGSVYEPLRFAFNNEQKFVSSKDDLLKTYKSSRRSTKYRIAKSSFLPSFTFLTLLFFLIYHDPQYAEVLRPQEFRAQQIQDSIKAVKAKEALDKVKKPTKRTRRAK